MGGMGTVDTYQPLVKQIESLLEQRFVLIDSAGGTSAGPEFRIYKRRGAAS